MICGLSGFSVYAQDNTSVQLDEPFETDRPSIGNSARVVPKSALQMEFGLLFENDETNFESDKRYELPSALVRYGLLDMLELRLRAQLTHRVVDVKSSFQPEKEFTDTGVNGIMLGTKIQLLKSEGARPDIAFQAEFELPVGDETLKPDNLQPKLRLNFRNNFTEAISLNYNLGLEWEENNNLITGEEYKTIGLYTLAFQYKFSESFGAYVEAFGELHQSDMRQSFDIGAAYRPMPNLQLDLFAGAAMSEEAPDYFVSAGVSIRLPD